MMTVISTKRVMVHLTVKTYRAKLKQKTNKNPKIKRIQSTKGLRKLLKSKKRRSKKNLLSP